MRPRRPRAPLLAAILVAAFHGADPSRAEGEGEPAAPPPPRWSVEDPGGPYREFSFDAAEGTWMSVDVHPDGTRLVFDLLGDIYALPMAGGEATLLAGGLPYEVQPRWSPDGRHVLFTSDRGGGDNLWVMDGDGGNRRALTREDFRLLNNGNWHPTGRWVVARKHFTSRRSLGAGEMWLHPFPEGGPGVKLTTRKNDQQDAGEPVFTPDGRFLLWSEDMSGGTTFEYNKDPAGTIYVVRRLDMETGEVRDLIRQPGGAVRPQPSPDGSTVAFVRRARDRSVLALFDVASGSVRDLFAGLSLDQQETWAIFGPYPGYSWTPDGRSLVVWGGGTLHRVDVATGEARPIPFRAAVKQRLCGTVRFPPDVAGDGFDVKVVRWPQVSGDGRFAVFQALGRLWRRALPDGAPERITGQEADLECAPRLAPDGVTVVYVTWNDVEGGRVRSVRVDGSEGRLLVARPGHYLSADLSPDGREVVFHRGGPDVYRGRRFAEDPGVWSAAADTTAPPRLLARQGRSPRWSADGARVFLLADEGEEGALVSVDRLGSDRRVHVISERGVDFVPSPDGRWLAFEELWQAYLVPLPPGPGPFRTGPKSDAPPPVRLSRDAGTYLSWSPDGSRVRWSLGPDLFECDAAEAWKHGAGERERRRDESRSRTGPPPPKTDPRGYPGATGLRLGWRVATPPPATDLWLTGGRVVPMHDDTVIEDGVVHVVGDRIAAVGTRAALPVPAGARVLDCRGKTVLPGLVDVHSHTGSSTGGVPAQRNWAFLAMLAFGVTTSHDPSNDTQSIYAESEMVRAGLRVGPRILSTGTILYGAEGDFRATVDSYEDALQEVRRTAAWGPCSVKSYQLPRREQRQQVIRAAREVGVNVVPEGGSTLHANLSEILDGHTTIEHAIPVAPLHAPEVALFARSGTAYTPTLVVGYGGLWGENWWYAKTRVWEDEALLRWVPRSYVDPRARRRVLATDEGDYHHLRLARTAAAIVRAGGTVEIGAHGQLQGLAAHWETWMLGQGGLTPHEALRCATLHGARALGLDGALGSLRPGLLADLIVVEGNPLEDLRRSRDLRWTMVGGRLHDAATLEMLEPERRALPPGPELEGADAGDGHGPGACGCGR